MLTNLKSVIQTSHVVSKLVPSDDSAHPKSRGGNDSMQAEEGKK